METTPGPAKREDTKSKVAELSSTPSIAAEVIPQVADVNAVEDVPDPDEDDLDDLDDMLDEFSTVKLDPKRQPDAAEPVKSEAPKEQVLPSASEPEANLEDVSSEEEFAKQLQAGMADLLGELEKSPDMQAQFEDIFKEMSTATATEPSADTIPSVGAAGGAGSFSGDSNMDASFQETIRRTMDRMQSSGDQATAAAASGTSDDFMSEILKQMSSGDFNAEGSDEDFSKMLMGMMEQLTNKDILYEPMKELDDKFPEWLEKNKETTPKDDLRRYEEQRVIVNEIVAKFEESSYADANVQDREYIVERMQKMQAAGSPPSDLVGDMASAQEVFNAPEDQCNPQ